MSDLSRQKLPHLGLTSPIAPATSRRVLRSSHLLLSTLLTAASALAQNPAPQPAPPPAGNPAVPPVQPGAQPIPGVQPGPGLQPVPGRPQTIVQPQPAPAPTNDMARLYFVNADVTQVLEYYSQLAKKDLIWPTMFTNGQGGTVTINVTREMNKEDRMKIIEMTLVINGINLLPTEDPNILKVAGGAAVPAKSVGIPFIDSEENIPANEQIVMYLMKLQYQDATELANTLAQGLLAPNAGGSTSVVPLVKTNSLLITENTPQIRTLLRFVRAIDAKPIEALNKFFTLINAQAEEVATNLNTLLGLTNQQQQPGGTPGVVNNNVRRAVPAPRAVDGAGNPMPNTGGINVEQPTVLNLNGDIPVMTEEKIVVGKPKIAADKRTNRVHVVAREVDMKIIEGLIDEYDKNVELPKPYVRHIRFRPVLELTTSIAEALMDPGERTGTGAAGTGTAGQRTNPNLAGGTNTGASRFGQQQQQNQGNFGSGTTGSTTGGLGEGLDTAEVPTEPVSIPVGKSTIIADPRNQTLVVVGTKDIKDKVSALVDQLDVRQPQVMIHTVVGELRLNRNEQFGIDYILRNGGLLTAPTTPTTPTDPTAPTTPTTNSGLLGFVNGGGTFVNANDLLTQSAITKVLAGGTSGLSGVVLSGNALDVAVNALESNNRFRVVTRPSIFTLNAKRAVITSGEEVPVPTNITSGFTGGVNNDLTTNSSIQFKPIELRLEVLPLINNDREVTLEVVQNISERAGSTIIDNNAIPNISRRAVKTNVIVPNNGTLILGGLIKESRDFTRNAIPLLGRIPGLGFLFGNTTKDKTRNELIIMMRPVVTYDPGDTARLRELTMQDFNMPPDFEKGITPTGIWGTIPRAKVVPKKVTPIHVDNEVFNDRGRR